MKLKQLAVGILSAAVFLTSIPAVPAWAGDPDAVTGVDYFGGFGMVSGTKEQNNTSLSSVINSAWDISSVNITDAAADQTFYLLINCALV